MKKKLFIFITVIGLGVVGYYCLGPMSQKVTLDRNAVIEEAINIELPATDNAINQVALKIKKDAFKHVYEGDYIHAIHKILAGLKEFPQDFSLQSTLAALLRDCSEITPAPLKERMLAKAKKIFDRLIREADCQPKETFYPFKNEYLFRLKMYREQYELGKQRVDDFWDTKDGKAQVTDGFYCQGVGAARYAKHLIEQGNSIELAINYAQKALVAFAQYFSYENDYYNAYVHYALALGNIGVQR